MSMAPIVKVGGKIIELLADRVSEAVEQAVEHEYRSFLDEDGFIKAHANNVAENAYEELTERFPGNLYERYMEQVMKHPKVVDAIDYAEERVMEQVEEAASYGRMWGGTIYEQLREVGMSIHEFI